MNRKIFLGTSAAALLLGIGALAGSVIGSVSAQTPTTNPAAPTGAEVQGVTAGGPADGAGLTQGDVITEIDGQPVTGSNDVSSIVNGKQPGDHLDLRVDRSGQDIRLGATLGNRPARTP